MSDMSKSAPAILCVGKLPASVTEPLSDQFQCVDMHQLEQMEDQRRETIRGIAVLGAKVPASLIEALPSLEVIANFGVGYDNVDVPTAISRGIVVTHTPEVLNDEVADTAVGLLLMTVRRLSEAERYLRAGEWRKAPFPLSPGSLRGRHVGLVGMGRIGQAIARRIEAFGIEVSYHSRSPKAEVQYRHFPTLLGLASAVDTLIVIVPGGGGTRHLINRDVLAALGPKGILINVARGSVLDEEALVEALNNETILAAGLDVFENEPNVSQALLDAPNAVLLPHIGTASQPTRDAMGELVVRNIVVWFGTGAAVSPVPECRV
jgi:lactate dehydrogenase-like 2-hydroxyacid dehydrogenase